MIIETTNLRLTPLTPGHLLAIIEGDRQFEERFGLRFDKGLSDMYVSESVSPDWLAQLRVSDSADPWVFGFAVVHLESNLIIGTVGFKGPPDEDGMVEIAYGMAPDYQGKGYATEAALAGVAFAFGDDAVQLIRAHTLPTSMASMRVLSKCGFQYIGEVVDPDDGLVTRWEREREKRLEF